MRIILTDVVLKMNITFSQETETVKNIVPALPTSSGFSNFLKPHLSKPKGIATEAELAGISAQETASYVSAENSKTSSHLP